LSERETKVSIQISNEQANEIVIYLKSLSDRLTRQHNESFSGVDQLLIMSSIQAVDRLVVDISDKVTEPEMELGI
jgi:hypothetical protein